MYLCSACRIVLNYAYRALNYTGSYFLEDYKSQYGKTYIEDYDNIYRISSNRIRNILRVSKSEKFFPGSALLDIGSALGFFLKCSKDYGIDKLTGIEISDFASEYCKENFNIDVINSPFSEVKDLGEYDIITAWYYIEHSNDPIAEMDIIYNHLREGGIFAASLPSIHGPHFLYNRENWIEVHPDDHCIDFSPAAIKKILKSIGFRKVFVRAGGIHPERVLSSESIVYRPFSFIYKILAGVLKFSDTMEVYAVK